MARPIKQGLDYFPLDVDLDEKIELIEAKHGISGFGILIKLFQRIYKEGYFLRLSEESLLLFSKRISVNINEINAVINDCLRYQIFDEKLYSEYNILTSAGIQKRYLAAVDRRKEVDLIEGYIVANINGINVRINWINDCNNTQSKVKESKGEESKKNTTPKGEENSPTKNLLEWIIDEWCKSYEMTFVAQYSIVKTRMGKERAAAGALIQHYKTLYPNGTTEDAKEKFTHWFPLVMQIDDAFIQNNMTLPIVASKFNEINKMLRNGKYKVLNKNGNSAASREELTSIAEKYFPINQGTIQ
jgi:hypothetical protein